MGEIVADGPNDRSAAIENPEFAGAHPGYNSPVGVMRAELGVHMRYAMLVFLILVSLCAVVSARGI